MKAKSNFAVFLKGLAWSTYWYCG